MSNAKLIMLADLLEDRQAKQKELEYYNMVLQDLITKMSSIRREIQLTETIIDVIENEKVEVIQKFIQERDESRLLDL